ncbi:uncharacterized protein LOC129849468 isoform X2 [Salvelinus fontinalis]|uniref:uncharacterized protein LOC129847471 isoform X2 n=1 Tax=Salvelinus fontinalis TaxID=8038 RepID=UPI002485A48B|nr:uncharacterized protein LOC129847471 isoform X2 [Salvelinus fontinalis]XP_055771712.1 uncharacterized protein LOC129848572 isoform X2 [Salvelinus fontinalis]XP_055771717.1 uncharacterized protein LOC129848573 isoform X2 [Salvelinus fontinalis]XP_055772143.1 uncharacterized protein LOC129849229 isoform X2 [Salvelinus fontinalis]XP_055772270.1 uncharacterized protein LOC129849468 isoform X2 [Salvelinus fontinalis]
MGMCLPCLGGPGNDLSTTPDRETRRRELAEAAEKRQKEKFFSQSQLYPTHKTCGPTKASRQPTGVSKTPKQLREIKRIRRWRNKR